MSTDPSASLGHSLRAARLPATARPVRPPPAAKAPPFKSQYLNQAELERFENLLIFAQTTVEGYFAGRHKSPHFGFSAEFMEHKAYVQGDETAHLDWRVYARTRKLYSRKFMEETDMTIHLLADASPSMLFLGRGGERKYSRVARICAALAFLAVKQGDKAALGLFTDHLIAHTPAGGTRRHLFRLLQTLENPVVPATRTDIVRALGEAASRARRRGKLVVLSDFLGMDIPGMFDALASYVHRGFQVMLLQVLDPDELALPEINIARFRDMESGQEVQVEPEEIRAAYEREILGLTETIREQALRRRIDFSLLNTRTPYLDAIEAYLGFRRR